MNCFLYPGQGAQYIGMGIDFYDTFTEVRELFQNASDLAGFDVYHSLKDGTMEEISQTDKSQVLITVVNLAARIAMQKKNPPTYSNAVAGFSLGEYAALVDAEVIAIDEALAIVHARGNIMESHARNWDTAQGRAGMMAVLGLSASEITETIETLDYVSVAIYNSPQQTVLAGTADGLSQARQAFSHARKCIPLAVSGPFHSPLMETARQEFESVLAQYTFHNPKKPVYSNVTGAQETKGAVIQSLCAKQLVSPVQWTKTMHALAQHKDLFLYEIGPGRVLQGLWKAYGKANPDMAHQEVILSGKLDIT